MVALTTKASLMTHATRHVFALMAISAAATLIAVGCGESRSASNSSSGARDPVAAWSKDPSAAHWNAVVDAARGQTVRWWLYGGDARINAYIDTRVTPAAKRLGIDVERVPVDDTASAVAKVVAERRAGRTSGGAVDLIWINGENFASGKDHKLWLRSSWATKLPNSRRYVDWSDPSINLDLQVPVDGQESPWSRAALVWAYDSARIAKPPTSLNALLEYGRAHPGRVTYPAPPDFTGSAFVRYVVTQLGEDEAFGYLGRLRPLMWKEGRTFPENEAELNRLLGNGQVDFAMSFDPAFVESGVRSGTFARSTRPFVPESGTLTNVSYVTVPSNAANSEAALVLANLLLEPGLQRSKADPTVLGIPSVLRHLPAAGAPGAPRSKYLLDTFGDPVTELAADRVEPIERRWKREFGT